MPVDGPSGGSGLSKLVEKQMRNWELARAQRLTVPQPQRNEVEDFIAVSREVAAGGRDVAGTLGERLGWPVFDKELLQAMAGDDAIRQQIYASLDERDIGWYEETLRSLLEIEFVKNDYFHRLTQTVLSLARQGHAVFLGRGADRILPQGRGFRVRLVAPLAGRVERFATQYGLPVDEAARELARVEEERAAFTRRHFEVAPHDAARFDLVVNVGRFTPAQTVDLILAARNQLQ